MSAANRTDSELSGEPLIKRDTWDHDKFDIDLLRDVEGMNPMKQDWKFKTETVVATWILFNAVSTIMIIVANFRKSVPEATRKEFGEAAFDAVTYSVMYFPLIFFLLLWLLFNNAFSEMTFYMYIRRGAIVDFPASTGPRFLFTHARTVIFLIIYLAYTALGVYMMIYFGASIGTIAIYMNNLLIGVGLFWYRQQSIEWKFVSISDFIQAFPDRNNSHGNMDEVSLHHASHLMQKFTLTESAEPSYTGYMRNFYWNNQNYGTTVRILHHIFYWGVILALSGLSFTYFYVLGRFDLEARWLQEINPCAGTCVELAYNFTLANATGGRPASDFCAPCICKCLEKLQATDNSIREGCGDYVDGKSGAPIGGGIAHCGAAQCPSKEQCGFKDFLEGWKKWDK